MYCKKCGSQLKKDFLYCQNCGERISVDESEKKSDALNDDNNLPLNQNIDDEYKGIGGWLYLVAIGLFATPIYVILYSLFTGWWESFQFLDFDFKIYLIFEFVANVFIVGFCFYLIFIFFRKKKEFPIMWIVWTLGSLIVLIIDTIAAYSIFPNYFEGEELTSLTDGLDEDLIRQFVGACIWIPYMRVSKRVKATFIN
ncbi:MAG: DUF2569 family protein [Candidatus Komeilibacteria bacterium]